MIVQHSSESNEHYTPGPIVEMARTVMGHIALDPASTHFVNENIVKADFFHGLTEFGALGHPAIKRQSDSLDIAWNGTVFLNPPGGVVKGRSNAALWWAYLAQQFSYGNVTEAVFVGFTVEILRSTQATQFWIGDATLCFPKKRIAFLDQNLAPQKHPSHANVIAYLGPNRNKFIEVFGELGHCK